MGIDRSDSTGSVFARVKNVLGPMKYHFVYMAFIVAVISIVLNEIRKTESHEAFFHSVESFMKAGGRNTALHGYQLCVDINHLKAEYYHHHEQPFLAKSCAEIYGIDPETVELMSEINHEEVK